MAWSNYTGNIVGGTTKKYISSTGGGGIGGSATHYIPYSYITFNTILLELRCTEHGSVTIGYKGGGGFNGSYFPIGGDTRLHLYDFSKPGQQTGYGNTPGVYAIHNGIDGGGGASYNETLIGVEGGIKKTEPANSTYTCYCGSTTDSSPTDEEVWNSFTSSEGKKYYSVTLRHFNDREDHYVSNFDNYNVDAQQEVGRLVRSDAIPVTAAGNDYYESGSCTCDVSCEVDTVDSLSISVASSHIAFNDTTSITVSASYKSGKNINDFTSNCSISTNPTGIITIS